MIIRRQKSCLERKQKLENTKEDKHKQMRNNWKIDKLEQWVTNRAVKDEILGLNVGGKKQKVFFLVLLSLINSLNISFCFIFSQFTVES